MAIVKVHQHILKQVTAIDIDEAKFFSSSDKPWQHHRREFTMKSQAAVQAGSHEVQQRSIAPVGVLKSINRMVFAALATAALMPSRSPGCGWSGQGTPARR